jgi:hypothetical protein
MPDLFPLRKGALNNKLPKCLLRMRQDLVVPFTVKVIAADAHFG